MFIYIGRPLYPYFGPFRGLNTHSRVGKNRVLRWPQYKVSHSTSAHLSKGGLSPSLNFKKDRRVLWIKLCYWSRWMKTARGPPVPSPRTSGSVSPSTGRPLNDLLPSTTTTASLNPVQPPRVSSTSTLSSLTFKRPFTLLSEPYRILQLICTKTTSFSPTLLLPLSHSLSFCLSLSP